TSPVLHVQVSFALAADGCLNTSCDAATCPGVRQLRTSSAACSQTPFSQRSLVHPEPSWLHAVPSGRFVYWQTPVSGWQTPNPTLHSGVGGQTSGVCTQPNASAAES